MVTLTKVMKKINNIWIDIYEQPNTTAARNKLYEHAQKEGISK